MHSILMNPLDWMLAALLVYSMVRAALRGLGREAFALGGLILGFLLACWNYRAVAAQLSGLITSTPLAQLAAFLLILMGVMAVATLLGWIVQRTARAIGLGLLDRLGGALFGLARGALLGGALLLGMTTFLPIAPWMKTSSLAPYFLRADHAVSFVMPSELRVQWNAGLDRAKHTSPNGILNPNGMGDPSITNWIRPGRPSPTNLFHH